MDNLVERRENSPAGSSESLNAVKYQEASPATEQNNRTENEPTVPPLANDTACEDSPTAAGKCYLLRKRKRRRVIQQTPSTETTPERADTFRVEDEARAWDAFYTDSDKSDAPFSGFDTKVTVVMLRSCLQKIRMHPLVDGCDVILEVGHGKHPLIWDLESVFGHFGSYSGIEFSGDSVLEALKLRKRTHGGELEPPFRENVEFLRATSVNYFNPDGSCSAEVVMPPDVTAPRLVAGSVTLVVAKSTLDYITCRLTGSVGTMEWEDQPRISPSVVQMFDSFSTALGEVTKDRSKAVVFIEPGDFLKFRDHIATIARVIYAAAFRNYSPAQWLRLSHVRRFKKHRAVCYTLEKTERKYASYDELREDICRVTAGLYQLSRAQDVDWLLPITVPPKWNSSEQCDLEHLIAI
ncbi:uncharacterized protein BcabD6B2_47250 [Babesia caballi]|uniref:Uncharacterized protein n=1 Tax=Babesia caballi TaxID=5871 RepID=A0AAV4LZC8_BABCB|nr:hypothetical protein, conserved [Babesia caballi]